MSASPGLSNYSNETVFRRKKEKVGKSCFGHIANNAYNVIIMYLVTAQHCMVYIQHFDLKKNLGGWDSKQQKEIKWCVSGYVASLAFAHSKMQHRYMYLQILLMAWLYPFILYTSPIKHSLSVWSQVWTIDPQSVGAIPREDAKWVEGDRNLLQLGSALMRLLSISLSHHLVFAPPKKEVMSTDSIDESFSAVVVSLFGT